MADPARPQQTLRQIRQWIAAERRQRAWEQHWAKRLGLLFAILIGAFLLFLPVLIDPW